MEVHDHFDDKEAIVEAVLAQTVATQGAVIDAVTRDLDDPAELTALGPFARRDLKRGVKAGRLRLADERIALYGMGGALLGVMRAVLDGRAPRDADVRHAEGVLRMLGLTIEDAAEVAGRPFPAVADGDPQAPEAPVTVR